MLFKQGFGSEIIVKSVVAETSHDTHKHLRFFVFLFIKTPCKIYML